jgi:hypothetical protein
MRHGAVRDCSVPIKVPLFCSKYCTSITMDSGEREQEARQHADEQHNPREAAAGQQAAQYLLKSLSLLKILYV